jgi:probable H4MPT-linked C1 transfer pathway protein
MTSSSIMGWDIGGAHLKAALLDSHGVAQHVVQVACPLWRGLNELDQAIHQVQARMAQIPTRHAITMTGELVDLFENRSAGVLAIAQHLKNKLPGEVYFYAGARAHASTQHANIKDFVSFEQVPAAANNIASANWLASAEFVAQQMSHALFVDVGSTTTDLIAIVDGKVAAQGASDADRMCLDELVYSGVVRTPLMVFGPKVMFEGCLTNLAAEHFATTADVYRLTGDLLPEDDMADTADGAGKSGLESARRLARMIGHDVEHADLEGWRALAHTFKALQLERMREAVERISHQDLSAPLVGAGAGKFLVVDLAKRLNRPYIDATEFIRASSDHEKHWAGVCLPAYAVAHLALSYLALHAC